MDSVKYIGMDVRKESISIAVMNSAGKTGVPMSKYVRIDFGILLVWLAVALGSAVQGHC